MTRETAPRDLVARLDQVGFRAGRIDLPVIWDAVASWMRSPVADVAPEDDRRLFYLSCAPADAQPTDGVFAGAPPSAIAGIDLICIEFGRDFVRRTPEVTLGIGGAGVTLWYRAGEAWERLHQHPDWIQLGPTTPNFDWSVDGRDPAWLTAAVERSGVLEIASRERALALTICGDGAEEPDPLVIVATKTSG